MSSVGGRAQVSDGAEKRRRSKPTTEAKNSSASRHLTLHGDGNMKDELLDPLGRTRLDDGPLVALGASCQIPERRDGMALNLLILVVREEVDEGRQESRLDDGRLVLRVNGDVADAGGSGEDEGKEGGAKETEEGGEALVADDFELVLVIRGEVAEGEGGLALDLEARRVHEADEVGHELGLALRQFPAVVGCG